MKFNDIMSRVTGLSIPIFGVSWTPRVAEGNVARCVESSPTPRAARRVQYRELVAEQPSPRSQHLPRSHHDLERRQAWRGLDRQAGRIRDEGEKGWQGKRELRPVERCLHRLPRRARTNEDLHRVRECDGRSDPAFSTDDVVRSGNQHARRADAVHGSALRRREPQAVSERGC
jgi:hypothetical protein